MGGGERSYFHDFDPETRKHLDFENLSESKLKMQPGKSFRKRAQRVGSYKCV